MRCPRRPLLNDPETYDYLFWLYGMLQYGILPDGPSLNSNPAKLLTLFRIIKAAESEATSERETAEAKKRGRS